MSHIHYDERHNYFKALKYKRQTTAIIALVYHHSYAWQTTISHSYKQVRLNTPCTINFELTYVTPKCFYTQMVLLSNASMLKCSCMHGYFCDRMFSRTTHNALKLKCSLTQIHSFDSAQMLARAQCFKAQMLSHTQMLLNSQHTITFPHLCTNAFTRKCRPYTNLLALSCA